MVCEHLLLKRVGDVWVCEACSKRFRLQTPRVPLIESE